MTRLFPILAVCACLAGCAWTAEWVDTTGHHRGEGRADTDYKTCVSEAGSPAHDRPTGYDETETSHQRLLVCMYSHGWRPRRLDHL
ncbi:MAG TPA: hypothetical protein VHU23_06000 [Rhizomicrobium sp.]|nr:hypothetical protein [Rhizomicrobium sp.]